MPEPVLKISRRRLPHWRLEGCAYFITWRLQAGQLMLLPHERDLVTSAIRHFNHQRYELYAYVVMDDHVHVAMRLLSEQELSAVLHSWKSYTANQLQRKFQRRGELWLHESWDRIIRDEAELYEKCNYILNNPFKRWPELTEYKWAGWE
jgi:putative transposase